jgi:hypothetical protein
MVYDLLIWETFENQMLARGKMCMKILVRVNDVPSISF